MTDKDPKFIPFNLEVQNLPYQFIEREDASIEYADGFFVTHTDEEFIISFLQLQHPMALTPQDAEKIESIDVLILKRIAISPKRMETFLEMIQQDFQRFLKEHGAEYLRESKADAEPASE
jgi:hypothetical protein